MAGGRRQRSHVLIVVAVAAALGLWLWLLAWDPSGGARYELSIVTRTPSSDAGCDAGAPGQVPATPRAPVLPAECRAHATKQCHQGDLWWFDSCEDPEALAEACKTGVCNEGRCEVAEAPAHSECGSISPYGSCDGEVAKACVAGQLVAIDCHADGARCALTSEGAVCLPRDPVRGCNASDRAQCVNDRLRQCVDGLWTDLDCRLRGGHCSVTSEGARCRSELPPLKAAETPELCDGVDNDHDGRIDEASSCEAVALVAFVPEGAKLADLETRMPEELAILNRVMAPLSFRWAKTVKVGRELRSFDTRTLEATAAQLARQESRASKNRERALGGPATDEGLDFYVPVLFTENLRLRPPKAGISTLPNSRCGGVRIADDPAPADGLIVVSEARQPETLTHEMGHYLGLCHTHEELTRYIARTDPALACHSSGDGICDTPEDPGPTQCQLRDGCVVSCIKQPTQPEAANIMSYYVPCRRALSAEQLLEVQRNLALRRGWFACLDATACPCQPGQTSACPAEMSCHPSDNAAAFSCELDGPGVPGAPCRGSAQCGSGALCLRDGASAQAAARCVRVCLPGSDCSCLDVGLGFRVCAQDLKR